MTDDEKIEASKHRVAYMLRCDHLPSTLAEITKPFAAIAGLVLDQPDTPERSRIIAAIVMARDAMLERSLR